MTTPQSSLEQVGIFKEDKKNDKARDDDFDDDDDDCTASGNLWSKRKS
jgi:hypothetical protein